jgi:hypothetical protein
MGELGIDVRSGAIAAVLAGLLVAGPAGALSGEAPAERSPAAVVTGAWVGHSYCADLEVAPACQEEDVRLEFRAVPGPEGEIIRLDARKKVDGAWQPMGALDFGYDAASWSWSSEIRTPRFHGRWTYRISEFVLHGTLVELGTGKVVRRVSAEREGAVP